MMMMWEEMTGVEAKAAQSEMVKKLGKLELTLSKAQQLMHFGTWELDLETMIRYWSDEVYDILEIDPDKRTYIADPFKYYSPDSITLVQTTMAKSIADGTAWDIEVKVITEKGNERWVRACGDVTMKDGKAVKLFGIIQDINEHKRAEENLKVLFEHSADAHLLFNENGLIDCNHAAVEMLLLKNKAELLSSHPAKFSPEYQPDGRRSDEKSVEMDRIAREKGIHQFEWIHRRANGEDFPVQVTLKSVTVGDKPALLVVWHDITQRKRAEERLRQSEAMLTESQQLTHSGSWEADLVTGKNYWSAEAFRIFGLEPDSTGPATDLFYKMIHPDDKELYKTRVNEAINKQTPSSFDLRIILPSGKVKFIRAIGKPFVNAAGKVTKLYGAIQDIDDHKRSEAELIKAKELAEQAAVAKSQFLSTMSHEIRTPMNAVIGFTHLLLQHDPRPDQQEYLNILKFSSENLLVLINDILDFNKIEAGKLEFEEVDFNLSRLIDNIRLAQLQRAQEKNIKLKLMMDEDLPNAVIGDPIRLGQILTNLISNAVKFTKEGKVVISATLAETQKDHTIIDFEVADTGIGIAPDKIDSIFESFTQASSDTTRKFGGSGLGLTISKRLLELMGSKISVKSEVGQGSVFSFSLKLKISSKQLAPVLENIQDIKSLKGTRLLIADDNQINVLLAKQFMKQWDVDCDVAENGVIAYQLIQTNNYDMVLMDLQMPEMDGYQTTEKVRQLPDEKYASLPIIALTASAMLDIKDKAFESGMNDYISKPFNPDDLYRKIATYSGRRLN
ncbi:hybrid sensor histidine kinase/response regulator [Mucilaginibacter sp. PPCGB 2223]|uniref:ATP-binding protein n=1 Tax=Mucilaginibacter sp. PPCGB 2223 TaxID=1886027 RepID=UPI0008249721|nr:ATP-binding protein [Mucilaginibacter sp. PPCGB 2223]OCX51623.1 hybrid sensor histidine kinase/response regulator [Mucilaginibacter sp. PPCGB 2223]